MDLHTIQLIHYAALVVMVLVYAVRIAWFLRFPAGKERQPPTGVGSAVNRRGILYSWFIVANPTGMESYRKHRLLYVQFVVFHLGVVSAITMSFVIADFTWLMDAAIVIMIFRITLWAALAVGVMRIVRRVGSPYLRAISSPDDYFSLVLLTAWFAIAAIAAPHGPAEKQATGETVLIAYYLVQTFFLLYVPFSKISHYLYYPFTRYYLGKSLGRRGVYPAVKTGS